MSLWCPYHQRGWSRHELWHHCGSVSSLSSLPHLRCQAASSSGELLIQSMWTKAFAECSSNCLVGACVLGFFAILARFPFQFVFASPLIVMVSHFPHEHKAISDQSATFRRFVGSWKLVHRKTKANDARQYRQAPASDFVNQNRPKIEGTNLKAKTLRDNCDIQVARWIGTSAFYEISKLLWSISAESLDLYRGATFDEWPRSTLGALSKFAMPTIGCWMHGQCLF